MAIYPPPGPPAGTPPPPPAPAPAPAPPARSSMLNAIAWMAFWAFMAFLLLFAANLLGYGPAIVRFDQVSVVMPQTQHKAQPATPPVQHPPVVAPKRPTTPKKPSAPPAVVPAPTAPAPVPCCTPTPCCSTPAPQVVLLGEPQMYQNNWGSWIVDPNGGFHCPEVHSPARWMGGMKVLVQRPDGSPPYETWAPGCYR